MKIIYKLATDELSKINEFIDCVKGTKDVVVPQGYKVKIYVISDKGEVTELK